MDQARGALGHHPVPRDACAARDALARALTGAVWQCGDTDIEATLALLDDVDALTCALRSSLLMQAEQRSMKDRTRAPSTERWLTDRFRLSRSEANARMHQAAQLARQPIVTAALAVAAITVEQATVIATALDHIDAMPGVDASERAAAGRFLVEHAAALPPRDLARVGQELLEALSCAPSVDDPADEAALERERERAEAEAQAAERNGLTVTRRPNGRFRGRFDLGPLGGAALAAWLRQADKPVPGTDGFEDLRTLDQRRGDALVDALAAACCHRPGDGPVEQGESPYPHLLFDRVDGALAYEDAATLTDPLAEDVHDDRDPGSGSSPISPVALLSVTVTLAELRGGLAGAGRLDTGATVSAATLRQLACDALVVPAVLGSPSQVLDLGRATRTWTIGQRRAVALRDRHCTAPGCDRPPQACQVHHEWTWEDGGPTDVDNGALLCGFHHRMVHRQGWAVRLAANGWPEFVPPKSIDPEQRPRQHHRYALQLVTTRSRT